jgi:hypothetical protein
MGVRVCRCSCRSAGDRDVWRRRYDICLLVSAGTHGVFESVIGRGYLVGFA